MDLPDVSDGGSRSHAEVGFIFQTWMSKQGKIYTNGLGEKEERFQIFKDNLHFIDQHNAKNLGYKLVAAVEGINKIVTGELISLSEQQLVDCNMENYGCAGGGFMDKAFNFLINSNIGLDSQIDYPYNGVQGYCNSIKTKSVTIDGYEDVPPNDEISLQKAVAHQPVSVGVDKSSQEFMLYQSGIFNGPCGTNLDHALVIVGYGNENGQDYWIVRNSWGTKWGEAGYAKIARNHQISTGKKVVLLPVLNKMARGPRTQAVGVKVGGRAAETDRNLTKEDAKRYLKEVEKAFENKVGKNATFLKLMVDFKHGRISVHAWLLRVKELLRGHNKLIAGFNIYVPHKYKLKIDEDDGDLSPDEADSVVV
ncbi:hypothetical protein AALP_AAs45238U000100 [Arabis alpina]|uniref:Peptidase C1A papain C-terminal domain-containing protein n=1 Tax=Arabis alpina TaxID=50452 RepID=A0A087FYF2_ARAAL|nr:hypothetical protein AALP_AAs45238U000100 [Arabis alpina]